MHTQERRIYPIRDDLTEKEVNDFMDELPHLVPGTNGHHMAIESGKFDKSADEQGWIAQKAIWRIISILRSRGVSEVRPLLKLGNDWSELLNDCTMAISCTPAIGQLEMLVDGGEFKVEPIENYLGHLMTFAHIGEQLRHFCKE